MNKVKKAVKVLIAPVAMVAFVSGAMIVGDMNKEKAPVKDSIVEVKAQEVKKEVPAEVEEVTQAPVAQNVIEEASPLPVDLNEVIKKSQQRVILVTGDEAGSGMVTINMIKVMTVKHKDGLITTENEDELINVCVDKIVSEVYGKSPLELTGYKPSC